MTLEELEKRVRALEDAEEIKTLHREYLFYISNLEIDKALDCFAENITTEIAQYGIGKGKKEVGKFFQEVIRIIERVEVLDNDDKSIRGLYAAGVATSGWEAESYCSDLNGSTFGYAINSGRIAVENAAEFISTSRQRKRKT